MAGAGQMAEYAALFRPTALCGSSPRHGFAANQLQPATSCILAATLRVTYTMIYATGDRGMSHVAKLFTNGRSQAVRLPAAYRFDAKEVFIRRDPDTGDVILSRRPTDWDGFFAALREADVPANFLDREQRDQVRQDRDPFAG